MIAASIDVAVALLVVGVLALCVTTAATTLDIRLPRGRRRRRVQSAAPGSPARRVITGPPASLPPIELGPAPSGTAVRSAAGGQPPAEVREAEALIDRMLERDPELVARLFTSWIADDDRPRRDERRR